MIDDKDLQMSVGDIVADYRTAANKNKQIVILADINLCSRRRIAQLLKDAGQELPKAWEEALTKPEKRPRSVKKAPDLQNGPEAKRGLTVSRMLDLLSGLPDDCPILMGSQLLTRMAYTHGYDATLDEVRYCVELE